MKSLTENEMNWLQEIIRSTYKQLSPELNNHSGPRFGIQASRLAVARAYGTGTPQIGVSVLYMLHRNTSETPSQSDAVTATRDDYSGSNPARNSAKNPPGRSLNSHGHFKNQIRRCAGLILTVAEYSEYP